MSRNPRGRRWTRFIFVIPVLLVLMCAIVESHRQSALIIVGGYSPGWPPARSELKHGVTRAAVSPDGSSVVVSWEMEPDVEVYDIATRKKRLSYTLPGVNSRAAYYRIVAEQYSPDGYRYW